MALPVFQALIWRSL